MAEIYSVLITGANRGIGLEFVEQFLTNTLVKTEIVIATCRSPEKATALNELAKNHSNLHILELNVTEFDAYDSFVKKVQHIVGPKGLTLLINNAGIGPPLGMQGLVDVDAEDLLTILKTNAIAPVMLTKALQPLLKLSAEENAERHSNGLSITRAAVINISSGAGSIHRVGVLKCKLYGYSESKAALNMSTQTLSIELFEDGILVESINPGLVDTDMTKERKLPAQMNTKTSVTEMLKLMLSLREKNKNGFYTFDGQLLPF